MTVRHVWHAIVCGLFVAGAIVILGGRGHAQVQSSNLPDGDTWTTVVGCLQQGLHKRFVLIRPTTDEIASVPEAACGMTASDGEPMLELHDTHERLDESLIGSWVQVNGRLEHFDKHDDAHDPREFHVKSPVIAVPVVIPRAAAIEPSRESSAIESLPAPAPAPAPAAREEMPVATTGSAPAPEPALPKTATSL